MEGYNLGRWCMAHSSSKCSCVPQAIWSGSFLPKPHAHKTSKHRPSASGGLCFLDCQEDSPHVLWEELRAFVGEPEGMSQSTWWKRDTRWLEDLVREWWKGSPSQSCMLSEHYSQQWRPTSRNINIDLLAMPQLLATSVQIERTLEAHRVFKVNKAKALEFQELVYHHSRGFMPRENVQSTIICFYHFADLGLHRRALLHQICYKKD